MSPQIIHSDENPFEAMSGAVREFTTRVLPTLPASKRDFLAERLGKAEKAKEESKRLQIGRAHV